jgi:putative peptidoglycan lipid II flippase
MSSFYGLQNIFGGYLSSYCYPGFLKLHFHVAIENINTLVNGYFLIPYAIIIFNVIPILDINLIRISMNLNLNKKSILKKTFQVGILTFLSRILGVFREVLQVNFLGVGALSDAFITAFRIPNFFRHIFAEGALNASFVPMFVKTLKQNDRKTANGLMTAAFLFFQGIIFLLYLFILVKTKFVVKLIAPGFSVEQIEHTITFLRILFIFLFLVSGSALLGGALNSINHFFIPAFGPPLLNVAYIASLAICLTLKLHPTYLCMGIILGGVLQLFAHFIAYFGYNFSFGKITKSAKISFKNVLSKFFPCLVGVSIVEINLFVGGMIASFLPKGSVTLLYYGGRLMNIPLGIFAVAFANILLPHFSRIVLHAPKRLNFYLLETTKFISWVIIPAMIFFMINSEKFFSTIFLVKKGTSEQIYQAKWILIVYCMGLLFFCLNKILLNIFYSLKDTRSTTIASVIGATVNLVGDIIGIFFWGVYGIAGAAALSGLVMTLTCFILLYFKHKFKLYVGNFFLFLGRYLLQLMVVGVITWVGILIFPKEILEQYLATTLGYWTFSLGYAASVFAFIFLTRQLFGINLYFLRK